MPGGSSLIRLLLIAAAPLMLLAGGASPASAALTAEEVAGVVDCQEAIKKEGQKFASGKLKTLEQCLEGFIEPWLLFENGLIDSDTFDALLDEQFDKCFKGFEKITKASTKFVDKVVAACEPVEALVLAPGVPPDGDPLGFLALADFVGVDAPTSAVELAGLLCGGKEILVDLLAALELPRPLFELGFPPILLDERCEAAFLPLLP